jgi:uncharacterized membrane protein YhaH (DUF805 family)
MYGILILVLSLTVLMSGIGIFIMRLVDDKKNQKICFLIFVLSLIIGYFVV